MIRKPNLLKEIKLNEYYQTKVIFRIMNIVSRGKMIEEKQPSFAFEKKLGVHDMIYGNIPALMKMIERLLYCMKETNKNHGVKCEFFRLDFRQPYLDETFQFPIGSFILDLKFGSKKELKDKEVK